ncbi:MAG: hypothetical protein DRP65_02295 [Planctomycetota bacterium]|nr:MAG: hypothetical protein DRP65_02295 [Planctomycetota bacterium]
MAKVLIFNNFLTDGQESVLAPKSSKLHQYFSLGPGRWQANPYAKGKHVGVKDLVRRFLMGLKLWFIWRKYDVLIVDTAITALIVSAFSLMGKWGHRIAVSNFNVPRHRTRFWKWLLGIFYRRVDHFFVHSTYDIHLSSELYDLCEERFTYHPYLREAPTPGAPNDVYLFDDGRDYIMSFGGNARDYETFFRAIGGADLSAIVVARDYNLQGLNVPDNVRAFCNIPLSECDKLVSQCLFTVFMFDGSEPSCGQISIVTSLMLAKPVICTDLTGVRDYVTDGQNGLLVETRDVEGLRGKMLQLIKDRQLYDCLAAGARSWAKDNADPVRLRSKVDALVTELTSLPLKG